MLAANGLTMQEAMALADTILTKVFWTILALAPRGLIQQSLSLFASYHSAFL